MSSKEESKKKIGWKHHDVGWGQDFKFAQGLILSVNKTYFRDKDEFYFNVFGMRSNKKDFETIEQAKQAGMKAARRLILQAAKTLEDFEKGES